MRQGLEQPYSLCLEAFERENAQDGHGRIKGILLVSMSKKRFLIVCLGKFPGS